MSGSCCTTAFNHHPHRAPDLVQVAVTAPEYLSAARETQKSALNADNQDSCKMQLDASIPDSISCISQQTHRQALMCSDSFQIHKQLVQRMANA